MPSKPKKSTRKTAKTSNVKAKKANVAVKKASKGRPLTKKEMRIAIAKDVLAQLKARKIVAQTGTWVEDPKRGDIEAHIVEGKDVCSFVNGANKCKVCALGSIFMSQARLDKNLCENLDKLPEKELQFTVDNLFNFPDESPLSKYFSTAQLELIECAFEGGGGAHIPSDAKDVTLAEVYHDIYNKPSDRLEAIMKNIIANDGTFSPRSEVGFDQLLRHYNF